MKGMQEYIRSVKIMRDRQRDFKKLETREAKKRMTDMEDVVDRATLKLLKYTK